MKRTILLWMAAALLLCGCAAAADVPETTAIPEYSTSVQARPEGYYAPGSELEQQTDGAVRVYPLDIPDCRSIAFLGEDLLVFSGSGSTQLTLLRGEERYPAVLLSVDAPIDAGHPSAQVTPEGISWFNEATGETVLLDESLREITRIPAPEGMTGSPLLSGDRLSMYYCTGEGIWALDLETGIPRLLRQSTRPLTLERLLLEDTLLQCRPDDGSQVFCSVLDGQQAAETDAPLRIATSGTRYTAVVSRGEADTLVFGSTGSPAQTLSALSVKWQPMAVSYGALAQSGAELHYYDLSTGMRRSSLTLDTGLTAAADGGNGVLWLLDGTNTLYRWDTNVLPSGDTTVYADTYYTRSNPDLAGIAQCQSLAAEIGERHGVEILVWEDALAVAPWDYRVTEEYQVPVLREQLALLDQRLGNFPEGFLAQLAENCSGLTICLVQQLEGYSGLETVEAASGVQYWLEDHAYIALAAESATEGGLYHELCHVIDTRVIAESNAYDQWEALNPSGFKYDYDYAANASRNAGEYLRDAERCFIDTYSMSFPKEDRARILEYAMTPGNEGYFQSKTMQAKLMQICLGFRDAFGLKKSGDTFLWEQYLNESLAYGK